MLRHLNSKKNKTKPSIFLVFSPAICESSRGRLPRSLHVTCVSTAADPSPYYEKTHDVSGVVASMDAPFFVSAIRALGQTAECRCLCFNLVERPCCDHRLDAAFVERNRTQAAMMVDATMVKTYAKCQ